MGAGFMHQPGPGVEPWWCDSPWNKGPPGVTTTKTWLQKISIQKRTGKQKFINTRNESITSSVCNLQCIQNSVILIASDSLKVFLLMQTSQYHWVSSACSVFLHGDWVEVVVGGGALLIPSSLTLHSLVKEGGKVIFYATIQWALSRKSRKIQR